MYTLMSGFRVVLGAFGEGAQGNLQVGSYQVGTLTEALMQVRLMLLCGDQEIHEP